MQSWEIKHLWFDHIEYVDAETRSKARMNVALRIEDADYGKMGDILKDFEYVRRVASRPPTRAEKAAARVVEFNRLHKVGDPVVYWTMLREGDGVRSRTRSVARVMCNTAVVWVEGHSACIALSHVEPVAA
jgi:hypothetical protein